MITSEIPVSLELPESRYPRSPGIHVSGIIRCMALEYGILETEEMDGLSLTDYRHITDPVARLRINIGLAWEEHYVPMLEGVVDHPGEMQVEGVYMTHDGESLDVIVTETHNGMTIVVHEVKATYKSTKTVGDLTSKNNWMWQAQLMAYCKACNTRIAKMHVLFLCGNYKYPITPLLKCWLVEFTQEEIESNWQLLQDYKKYRLEVNEHEG